MKPLDDEERNELLGLIDQGLERLDNIEADIRAIDSARDSRDPQHRAVINAIDTVGVETQLNAVRKARVGLGIVRSKIELHEFSDTVAYEICDILDEIKKRGVQIRDASIEYQKQLRLNVETN